MRLLSLVLAAAAVAVVVVLPFDEPAAADKAAIGPLAQSDQLQFVPNRGQWSNAAANVRFVALGDTAAWLHDDGYTLRFERWSEEDRERPVRTCSGAVVRTRFLGAGTQGFVTGREFATRHHFLKGAVAEHVRGVPSFATVTMQQVQPGIDVMFRPLPGDGSETAAKGPFEYDLLMAPGADLDSFEVACEGVESLRVDDAGRLVATIVTPSGKRELVQQAPVAWQVTESGRQPIEVAFRMLGTTRYGFVAAGRDATLPTVVDPGVVWATHLGGGLTDRIHDMQWREGDGVWVGGWTGSTDFPATVGAFQTVGAADGMVARLADDGQSLVFATYLGGQDSDQVRGIALAPDLTATVVGFTNSANFPTTAGAAQPTYGGSSVFIEIGDGFVTRLSASGDSLLGSTYTGGAFDDVAEDVVLQPNGDAIVVGWTTSGDMPIPAGGYQPALGGLIVAQSDGFVLGVAQNAQSFTFGTFLGGAYSEQFLGVDRDATTGDIAVTGWSLGADYPTTPAVVRPSAGGEIDAVLTRLNSTASTAVFSTYMGGIGEDAATVVKFEADGSVWIGGFTASVNYPATLTAPQQSVAGANDGFVTRISALGQGIVYSTLLGGSGQDRVRDLDLAAPGVMVVGEAGTGFPVTMDAVQSQFAFGVTDGFACLLTNNASTIGWSSYFGGSNQDSLQAVSLADSGLCVVAGYTYSSDFPIAPAGYQPQLFGVEDGVVVQLDLLTDIGPAMEVEPVDAPLVELAASGALDLIRFDLVNITDRDLAVDSVRVLVAGAGATAQNVTDVRVMRDVGGTEQLVTGLFAVTPGTEVTIPLGGEVIPARESVRFCLRADVTAAANGASVEVAAAIVDASAWQVHALGAGGGPTVSVSGPGRATGPVYVLGGLGGDVDGSGEQTVVDVRRLITSVGTPDLIHDTDGDGVRTLTDVHATLQSVLGRGVVFSVPPQVTRGDWLLSRGLFPVTGSVQATLGGRALTVGRVAARQLSLHIDATQPTGVQELIILMAGDVLFAGFVEVF